MNAKGAFRLLILANCTGVLLAQQTGPAKGWDRVIGSAPQAEIRATLVQGGSVRGSLVSASADSLVIRTAKGEQALARQDVRRAEVKRTGHRVRNMAIGLAVGAGGGAAIAVAAHSCTGFGCIGADAVEKGAVPVLAVLGGLIGATLPSGAWKEIYRAPR
jgi:hypothetical protein